MASAAEQLAANLNFGAFAKATELHKRLWFTLGALIVYRIGTYIPIPGIDPARFAAAFQGQAQGILGMFNMFSGGAVERMAIFALNVTPYISASIIVQLMGTVYGPWEKLRKEGGEAGRKTLNQYTRYLTVVLALVQSFGIAVGLQNGGLGRQSRHAVPGHHGHHADRRHHVHDVAGEQITARGVGNGISLIIFAGIVAALPGALGQLLTRVRLGELSPVILIMILILAIAVVAFIVFIERSQRRLLVQYPKRQQGGRQFGGRVQLPAAEGEHRRA
jgi:preprotein translocase subunit SecY